MIEYSTMKKVFTTAAELREDFIALQETYGIYDKAGQKALTRYLGAIDVIQAIGGTELEDEFLDWYKEVYSK